MPLDGSNTSNFLVIVNCPGGCGALLYAPQDEEQVRGAAAASGHILTYQASSFLGRSCRGVRRGFLAMRPHPAPSHTPANRETSVLPPWPSQIGKLLFSLHASHKSFRGGAVSHISDEGRLGGEVGLFDPRPAHATPYAAPHGGLEHIGNFPRRGRHPQLPVACSKQRLRWTRPHALRRRHVPSRAGRTRPAAPLPAFPGRVARTWRVAGIWRVAA